MINNISYPTHSGNGPGAGLAFQQAKDETLRRAHQAIEDLNALGLKYRLIEGDSGAGNKSTSKKLQKK
jgi:hypothetical protein